MLIFCVFFSVLCLLCLCAHLFICTLVVTCWQRAALLAVVCGVYCEFVTFPLVFCVVWYLIVSIPYPCTLTYFVYTTSKSHIKLSKKRCQETKTLSILEKYSNVNDKDTRRCLPVTNCTNIFAPLNKRAASAPDKKYL